MKLKIRTKPDGRLQVLDGDGRPVDGVLSVSIFGSVGESPLAKVTLHAQIAIDAEADEVDTVSPPDKGL